MAHMHINVFALHMTLWIVLNFSKFFTACEELLPKKKKKGEEGHLCPAVINCVLVFLEC